MKKGFILFLALILFVEISYASFNEDIKINDYSVAKNTNWNVYLSSNENDNTIITDDEIKFNADLNVPGDIYKLNFKTNNDGNYNAIIDNVTYEIYDNNELVTLPKYLRLSVTNKNGLEITKGELLKKNTKEEYILTLEYRTDIEASDLPKEDHKYEFIIKINYVQAINESI